MLDRLTSSRGPVFLPWVAALALFLPTAVSADCLWTHELEWGSFGSAPGQFQGPQGLAFNSVGELHVADAVNHRIQVFEANGSVIRTFGQFGTTNGRFKSPHDVAFDAFDNLYVADRGNDRIQKLDPFGGYISQWGAPGTADGEFDEPWGVAVNEAGDVFVAERSGHRIQKFTSDGTWLLTFGGFGSGNGQLDGPRAMDFSSDGSLYVTETVNNRVSVFTPDGVFLFRWGDSGSLPGRFHNPNGLRIDDQDFVHVLCWYTKAHSGRVQRFTPGGSFVCEFLGSQGTGPLQFNHAQGLELGPGSTYYIADTLNHRIQVVGETGATNAGALLPHESWARQKVRFR